MLVTMENFKNHALFGAALEGDVEATSDLLNQGANSNVTVSKLISLSRINICERMRIREALKLLFHLPYWNQGEKEGLIVYYKYVI